MDWILAKSLYTTQTLPTRRSRTDLTDDERAFFPMFRFFCGVAGDLLFFHQREEPYNRRYSTSCEAYLLTLLRAASAAGMVSPWDRLSWIARLARNQYEHHRITWVGEDSEGPTHQRYQKLVEYLQAVDCASKV